RRPPEELVVHGHRAAEPAHPAAPRLPDAEEADDVAPIGVEAKRPARQRAGVRREDRRAALARARRELPVAVTDRAALVADLAHELAAAVLVNRVAEMGAQAEPQRPELVRRVPRDREAAQGHDPAALLALAGDVRQERWHRPEREALRGERVPGELPGLDVPERGVELAEHPVLEGPEP